MINQENYAYNQKNWFRPITDDAWHVQTWAACVRAHRSIDRIGYNFHDFQHDVEDRMLQKYGKIPLMATVNNYWHGEFNRC